MTCSRYFRDYDITLVGTPASKDGGRDAEATILMAAAKRPADADLSLLLRMWIEVKSRKANIGLDDIGKNFVRAINEDVAKIILVTNSGFSSGVEPELQAFCRRLRLGYTLIDGARLTDMARRLGVGSPQAALEFTRPPRALPARTSGRPRLTIRLAVTSDPQTSQPPSPSVPIQVDFRAPVFLTVDLALDQASHPVDVAVAVQPRTLGIGEVHRYGLPRAIPLDDGGHRRDEFVFFANQRAPVAGDAFLVTARANIDLRTQVSASGTCTYGTQILSDWIPPSRQRALERIGVEIDRWRESGRVEAQLLVAPAGIGKSHCIALLRRRWLTSGALEIPLDGDACRSSADIFNSVFHRVFPLAPRALGEDQTPDVAQWLVRAGMVSGGAEELAAAVCRNGSLDAECHPVTLLAEVLSALLRRHSHLAPAVLLYEDLHKAHPSALELLDLTYRNLLRSGDARVLFVLTTRPHATAATVEEPRLWHREFASLAGTVIRTTRLLSFRSDEAIRLLRETLPSLEEHHCRRVLRMVGRSAFGLREAIASFHTARLIKRDAQTSEWRIPHPERLARAIRASTLAATTEWRLGELVDRLGAPAATVLDAAACIGSRFPLEACLAAADAHRADVEDALREFADHEVLRPAPDDPDACIFDHDLIRVGVLHRMGTLRQRAIAGRLVDQGLVGGDDYQRALLEYQAGRAAEAVVHLRTFAADARTRTRHVDAVRALSLALSASDPESPSLLAPGQDDDLLPEEDDAVRVAEPARIAGVPDCERRRVILDIVTPLVESLFEIGSGASDRIERAITEGAMLARASGVPLDRARYEFFMGRRAFDQGRFTQAIEHHREADALNRTSETPSDDFATDNLVRLAVAQRQAGDREGSLRTLERAEVGCGPSDLRSLARIRANTGAVFFYSDIAAVRRSWESALAAAEQSGLPERIAHCLIDVATLDILGDRCQSAHERLSHAQRLAERHFLQNSLLRALLNGGCLDLIEGEVEAARRKLLYADELAEEYRLTRRLWRVRANLATLYEVRGELVASTNADEGAVAMVLPLLAPYRRTPKGGLRLLTREALALANVALRAEESPRHERILAGLDGPLQATARRIAEKVRAGRLGQLQSLLGNHCKIIGTRRRFIITE